MDQDAACAPLSCSTAALSPPAVTEYIVTEETQRNPFTRRCEAVVLVFVCLNECSASPSSP